ncbi:MAG: biotin/lipoyl-binding protein [Chloroflexi bacterium]|nr:biotin/lipoyl-binding protein [Chloroflexota bacterium]
MLLVAVIGGQQWVSRATAAPPPPAMRTSPVTMGSVTQTVPISGSINPSAAYRLSFRTAGKVTEVLVVVGDQVVKDQPLARIDTSDLRTALATAQNNLDLAQARYDQTIQGADPLTVADAKRALDKSLANYANAKSTLQSNVLAIQVDARNLPGQLDKIKIGFERVQAALAKVSQPVGSPIPPSTTEPPGNTPEPTASTAKADARKAVDSMNSAQASRDTARRAVEENLGPTLSEFIAAYTNVQAGIAAFDAAASSGGDTALANSFFQTSNTVYGSALSKLSGSIDTVTSLIGSMSSSVNAANSAIQTGGSRHELNLDEARYQMNLVSADLLVLSQSLGADKTKLNQTTSALSSISDSVSGGYLGSQSSFQRAAATPKPTDILSSTSSLESAKVALQNAQLNLDGATLRAPAQGTIATVLNQVGENVGTGAVMTMANTTSLTLRGTVGEADVAKLRLGQVATITVDAVGATASSRMTGKVTSIDPVATIQQGVPVYGVDVVVDIPTPGVRPGMSGTASVIIASRQGVITVPNLAIRSQGARRFVQVLRSGQAVDADVTFGLSTDTVTEVTSGLTTNDVVVLPQPRAVSSQPRPQGFGGGPPVIR